MKKIIYFIFLLLSIQLVLAGDEYGRVISGGDLLITDMDVAIGEQTSRNLEYGDDITKDANPSSVVEFQVRAKNNNSVATMNNVEMVIEINDLDLDDSTLEVDIDQISDKKLSLSFTIPSDVDNGDYDVSIEIRGELNDTIHRVKYELVLTVKVPVDAVETTTTPNSCLERIGSLNKTVTELSKEVNYFGPYTLCVSDRDTGLKTIEVKDTEIETLKGYQTKFETCNSQLLSVQSQKTQLESKHEQCLYNITNVQIPMQEQIKRTFWLWIFIGAGILGGGAYYKRKSLFPRGEMEKVQTEIR